MNEKLILKFPEPHGIHDESHEVSWFYISNDQILENGSLEVDKLSELKAEFHTKQVIVLVPSNDCFVTRVSIPTNQRRQQIKAVPFAIEEQLAEDIDDIHFAIGKRGSDQKLPVIAISKHKMEYWLTVLTDAGISATAIFPASALLEAPDDAWSIFNLDDLFIVNQNGNCWSGNADEAAVMLQLSINELEEEEQPAILYWGSDTAPGWVTGLGLTISEQHVQNAEQSLFARYDENSINLLQGDYEIQDDWIAAWSVWRRAAMFAILAIIIKFSAMGLELYSLSSEKQYLKQEITRVYQEVAPGARITAYPERQMRQLLARQQGGGNQSSSFLMMLDQVGESLSTTPGSKPTNINYDKSRSEIRIDLLVPSLPLLDQLKNKLVAKGLSVEVGGATAQGNDYSGRLVIRSES